MPGRLELRPDAVIAHGALAVGLEGDHVGIGRGEGLLVRRDGRGRLDIRLARLLSRAKLLMVCGRPSSVSVKSPAFRLVTSAPCLSRTVTGSTTSRA